MKRSKTSKKWMNEHIEDHYVHEAQRLGYRSRAAFKLLEANDKYQLIKPHISVLDLGSAPGSWSEVLSKSLAKEGKIIALDLLDMAPIAHVDFIQGDFREDSVLLELETKLANQPLDLVISDMAPNISGIKAKDQSGIIHLNELALDFARKWLKPNGHFFVKSFIGAQFDDFVKEVRLDFKKVLTFKPKSSRDRSSEVFVLGQYKLEN